MKKNKEGFQRPRLVSRLRRLPKGTIIEKAEKKWIGYLPLEEEGSNYIIDPDIGELINKLLIIARRKNLLDNESHRT